FSYTSRRRHTRFSRDWSSDVCSSDLLTTRKLASRTCWSVRSRSLLLRAERPFWCWGTAFGPCPFRYPLGGCRYVDHERAGVDSRSEARRVGKRRRPGCYQLIYYEIKN